MADVFTVKLYLGFSVIQDFAATFRTREEAEEFARGIKYGPNEAVQMLTNGQNPIPVVSGKDWPR